MLTTTPLLVYLFVALTGPLTAYPAHKVIYETTDKAACQAQAAAWNAAIAPVKANYFCFEHAQTKLLLPDEGR